MFKLVLKPQKDQQLFQINCEDCPTSNHKHQQTTNGTGYNRQNKLHCLPKIRYNHTRYKWGLKPSIEFSPVLWPLTHWQNGWHFADDIFKCSSLNWNLHVLIQISQNFVPMVHLTPLAPGGFDNCPKLVNFKLISTINIWSISCEIAIRWLPQHLTDH